MVQRGERRLSDGATVAVSHNNGLRKICGCPRRNWVKCPHSWHSNIQVEHEAFRFSLNRYLRREANGKTEAEEVAHRIWSAIREEMRNAAPDSRPATAARIRAAIRAGTYPCVPTTSACSIASASELSFRQFTAQFIDRSKDREKASWKDDEYMANRLARYEIEGRELGSFPLASVREEHMEAFIRYLTAVGCAASTRNHYVQMIRSMSRWAVRKGLRDEPLVNADSDVIRRKKEAQRHRRLAPGEEDRLISVASDHLKDVIIAALETCCRLGEILSLQWSDVSMERREVVLRAHKTKDRENRVLPMSIRLHGVLEMRRTTADSEEFDPSCYVFGNAVGEKVGSIKRAWQTAVLKAHGHTPQWTWTKKTTTSKGGAKLTAESQAAYAAINLHFHDLRHEAGSRLLEGGWPVHHVQHMLGHASLQQTSTYLNATLRGLHDSMRNLEQARTACKVVASQVGVGLSPTDQTAAIH